MKIVNTEEMRQIEKATDAAGHSYAAMMDMAGQATAMIASQLMLHEPEQNILILVGPGNNGGDGLVTARYLREQGHRITVYIWKRDTKGDENLRLLKKRRRGLTILWADNDPDFAKLREEVAHTNLVIDAVLGTGAARPIEGTLAEMLGIVRASLAERRSQATETDASPLGLPRFPLLDAYSLGSGSRAGPGDLSREEEELSTDADEAGSEEDDGETLDAEDWDDADWDDEEPPTPPWPQPPVLAVDCPSGLNCDTGALDPATIHAEATVTFGFPKWGHLQYPGAGACGLLGVADIGMSPVVAEPITTELVEARDVRLRLPDRPRDAHKGTFGKVMIVAGSMDYTGAAHLSAAAAARSGAGLVTLAIPAMLHSVLAGALPEVTWLPLGVPDAVHSAEGVPQLLARLETYDALLVGPGLTTSDSTRGFIEALFAEQGLSREVWSGRTVVDADALNILATLPGRRWSDRLPPGSILTPHPGEMARLIGGSPSEVNSQRITTARRWAAEWGHVVLLKGPHTVVAAPDGRAVVLPFAAPTLATAGSGDVLAGAIVAMLGQGLRAFDAAICGAYLHGLAGVILVRSLGLSGTVARDIVQQLPLALRQLYTAA